MNEFMFEIFDFIFPIAVLAFLILWFVSILFLAFLLLDGEKKGGKKK